VNVLLRNWEGDIRGVVGEGVLGLLSSVLMCSGKEGGGVVCVCGGESQR
jgi:hypothetical protein